MAHDTYTDDHIRSVLTSVKSIAVLGASPNPARPSHGVTGFLVRNGFDVVAVNPGHAGKIINGAAILTIGREDGSSLVEYVGRVVEGTVTGEDSERPCTIEEHRC